jgi:hypothetical protein
MTWWNDKNINIVEIEGELYALHGWNGEAYIYSWKCADRFTAIGDEEYEIKPVYDEIGGEDEDEAPEIIGYRIVY